MASGRLAAIGVAHASGGLALADAQKAAAPLRRSLAAAAGFRRFLDALYPPVELKIPNSTLVCRCEEVTAGQVRHALDSRPHLGPDGVKIATRAGMGPCQGRQCGLSLTRLVAESTGGEPGNIGFLRIRPPLKPLTPWGTGGAGDGAMTQTADVLVIGGGLHGLSAALQVARRGASVILLERVRIGRHSSGASAAGVRTLGRARAELPASLVAMDMWHDIEGLVGDDCGFHAHGQLFVAETESELDDIRARVNRLRQDGFFHEELVGPSELRELAPALARHCVGGVFTPRDGAADPHRTLGAFLRAALSAGVMVREGIGVSELTRRGSVWRAGDGQNWFEAPFLINAAGAWAGQIAAMAGDDIPLETKASMMIVTERIAPFVRPTVAATGRKLSFKQTNQGDIVDRRWPTGTPRSPKRTLRDRHPRTGQVGGRRNSLVSKRRPAEDRAHMGGVGGQDE